MMHPKVRYQNKHCLNDIHHQYIIKTNISERRPSFTSLFKAYHSGRSHSAMSCIVMFLWCISFPIPFFGFGCQRRSRCWSWSRQGINYCLWVAPSCPRPSLTRPGSSQAAVALANVKVPRRPSKRMRIESTRRYTPCMVAITNRSIAICALGQQWRLPKPHPCPAQARP